MKGDYEFDKGRLAVITQEHYDATYDIMGIHFTPDEPLCNAFGVTWDKYFQGVISDILEQNLSICMISNETFEVIGVLVMSVMKRSDPTFGPLSVQNEQLRDIFVFLHQHDDKMNLFDRYRVDEYIHLEMLAVHKDFRQKGYGGLLVQAAVALCRELGFEVITSEGTSNFSQKIFEKNGFEILAKLPYDSYIYKGQPIINGTGENTMTKIYGRKI